ncbi:MAG: 2-dehydropantoate 2-reductase [Lachnospiraceae bacterium]|nr:2-dehydropantoate 2-reductase [Lachnospiraceae bacterium]MBR1669252.1 2-dehydropantoate 2-reductase [Butyrivibrio sp.]
MNKNIYVDFDDCLCETAKSFSKLVADMFGKNVPYEDIKYFDLKRSFNLTDEQYDEMMIEGHTEKVLLSYEETPGASDTLRGWMAQGHSVSVITGRPDSAYVASRKWLDEHGLGEARLYCLNKYGRDSFIKNSEFNLELEDYYRMNFDIAVEDSPSAFKYFDHLKDVKVMVFNRPWNEESALPGDNYCRCLSWTEIKNKAF